MQRRAAVLVGWGCAGVVLSTAGQADIRIGVTVSAWTSVPA